MGVTNHGVRTVMPNQGRIDVYIHEADPASSDNNEGTPTAPLASLMEAARRLPFISRSRIPLSQNFDASFNLIDPGASIFWHVGPHSGVGYEIPKIDNLSISGAYLYIIGDLGPGGGRNVLFTGALPTSTLEGTVDLVNSFPGSLNLKTLVGEINGVSDSVTFFSPSDADDVLDLINSQTTGIVASLGPNNGLILTPNVLALEEPAEEYSIEITGGTALGDLGLDVGNLLSLSGDTFTVDLSDVFLDALSDEGLGPEGLKGKSIRWDTGLASGPDFKGQLRTITELVDLGLSAGGLNRYTIQVAGPYADIGAISGVLPQGGDTFEVFAPTVFFDLPALDVFDNPDRNHFDSVGNPTESPPNTANLVRGISELIGRASEDPGGVALINVGFAQSNNAATGFVSMRGSSLMLFGVTNAAGLAFGEGSGNPGLFFFGEDSEINCGFELGLAQLTGSAFLAQFRTAFDFGLVNNAFTTTGGDPEPGTTAWRGWGVGSIAHDPIVYPSSNPGINFAGGSVMGFWYGFINLIASSAAFFDNCTFESQAVFPVGLLAQESDCTFWRLSGTGDMKFVGSPAIFTLGAKLLFQGIDSGNIVTQGSVVLNEAELQVFNESESGTQLAFTRQVGPVFELLRSVLRLPDPDELDGSLSIERGDGNPNVARIYHTTSDFIEVHQDYLFAPSGALDGPATQFPGSRVAAGDTVWIGEDPHRTRVERLGFGL